jgi:tRNA(fMet)-specific endonuclease VapC
MRLVIDTNAYVAFCRGEDRAVQWFQRATEIAVPFVVLGELRAGFAAGTKTKQNERSLQIFLNSKRVRALWADEETTHHYSRLFAQLRKAGTPVPTNDLWIASLALQYGLYLLTFDEHFLKIPQLLRP